MGGASTPLSSPFALLAGLRDRLPAAAQGPGPDSGPVPDAGAATRPPAGGPVGSAKKIVVRRERKGHGGKTATRVEGLAASPAELETLARDWKRALGCGASVDGADVLVQGDQVERLVALLEARGARKVVVGN